MKMKLFSTKLFSFVDWTVLVKAASQIILTCLLWQCG